MMSKPQDETRMGQTTQECGPPCGLEDYSYHAHAG